MRIKQTPNRIWTLAIALFALVCGQAPAQAPPPYLTARVDSVLFSADDRWGGCMALLSVDPQTVRPSCAPGWVTFSCTGDFTDRVRAYRMADQAQLALATGKTVFVIIEENKKHNGYCFASRIDVYAW